MRQGPGTESDHSNQRRYQWSSGLKNIGWLICLLGKGFEFSYHRTCHKRSTHSTWPARTTPGPFNACETQLIPEVSEEHGASHVEWETGKDKKREDVSTQNCTLKHLVLRSWACSASTLQSAFKQKLPPRNRENFLDVGDDVIYQ